MYINIVRRPFKSNGVKYLAGQLITDPASIKRFKAKVNEGIIVSLERKSKTTIPTIKFLEQKLNANILEPVKEYLAYIDGKKVEDNKEVEDPAVDKQEEASEE